MKFYIDQCAVELDYIDIHRFYTKLPRPASATVLDKSWWRLDPQLEEFLQGPNGATNYRMLGRHISQWDVSKKYRLQFRCPQDVVMFKLAWGGR